MNEFKQVKFSFFLKLFGNRAGGFETALWEAFQRADNSNKAKLELGFPIHFQVFMGWYNAPSEREYFAEFLNETQGENNEHNQEN